MHLAKLRANVINYSYKLSTIYHIYMSTGWLTSHSLYRQFVIASAWSQKVTSCQSEQALQHDQ